MALGKNNYDSNQKLIVLRVKSKNADGEKVPPYYQISDKVGGEWVAREETVSTVSGTLVGIEPKHREFKGETIKGVAVYLKDEGETYLIDIKYNMLGRAIVNALLNVSDTYKPVEISLYENKKGYEAAAIRSGDDLVSWKFGLDELPKPDEIKDKKGNVVKRDFTEVDDFFDNEVKQFSATLSKSGKTSAKPAAKAKSTEAVAEAEVDDLDEEPLF